MQVSTSRSMGQIVSVQVQTRWLVIVLLAVLALCAGLLLARPELGLQLFAAVLQLTKSGGALVP